MIRGCQKKIIQIKDTQNDLFEEAYFVLKRDISHPSICERDIINEATSIVNSYTGTNRQVKIKRRRLNGLVFFLLGSAIGFLSFLVIYLLFL